MSDTITVKAITRRKKRFPLRGWIVWPLLVLILAGGGFANLQSRGTKAAPVRCTTTEASTGDITAP